MNKKFFYFITSLYLAVSASAQASTSTATSVAKVPCGVQHISLIQNASTFFSLPLSEQPVYTGMVSGVASNSITIASSGSTFTTSFSNASSPYFVQFLSGLEAGRTVLITANTSTTLTLDTTDHGVGSAVPLTTSSFSVAVGDKFEVFAGDTLASVFGAGSTANPLVLTGSSSQGSADQVSLWTTSDTVYYFNTAAGYWETTGSSANANNTIIYPYSVLSVYRRPGANATLLLTGQVTSANACEKVALNTNVYGSSHYATAITLGNLSMSTNWQTGSSAATADNLGIWSASAQTFTFYYKQANGNWYLTSGSSTATQNSVTIPAGGATVIYKRSATAGAQSFLVSAVPYSVTVE